MAPWFKVIALGLMKWPFVFIAPFVVPFLSDEQRVNHSVFGVRDATDLSWWNIGVRNSVHNMVTAPMPPFSCKSNTYDLTLEKRDGVQWRRCKSKDGDYVSFRVTWGKPRSKGKREFYVGWTLNDKEYTRLTFFQLRVF